MGNVTASDVLRGRREEILQRRKEVHGKTMWWLLTFGTSVITW
jgi:hypothetical protein